MGIQVTWLAFAVALGVVLVTGLQKAFNSMWLRPKKIESRLRQQGLRGNSFRFLYGDLKDSIEAEKEATSEAMSLSDDIVPRLLPFIDHSIKKHGKNSFLWMGSAAWVNIMEPELIREAFTKIRVFHKPAPNPLVELLGTGLASYEGERWAKHRRLINPAFHVEKLKSMLPSIHLSCSETVARWETLVADGGSCELDVWPELQRMMRDVISRTAFGSCYEEGKRIFEKQKELADLALQVVQTLYIPGWRFLPTKTNRRMRKLDGEIQATLRTIIGRKEEAGSGDLLGILVESNLKEIEEHGNERKAGLTLKEVMEECKLFYFAGQETTSSLLVWAMILLGVHEEWQARARAERNLCRVEIDEMSTFSGEEADEPIARIGDATPPPANLGGFRRRGSARMAGLVSDGVRTELVRPMKIALWEEEAATAGEAITICTWMMMKMKACLEVREDAAASGVLGL
uniref:Cytochrome P450 n=1 Tax=Kalanchoe fedtschenkoi TaxID=63787 RepID=A0A7N0VDZ4_KALFE